MALPDYFIISTATLSDNQAYLDTRSRSLITTSRPLVGQSYDFTVRTIPLSPENAKKASGWLAGIIRANDRITCSLPVISDSEAGTLSLSAAISSGDYDATLSSNDDVEVGDYFSFSNHDKVYQVTSVGSSGEIEFAPNLIEDVPSGASVQFDGVEFSFKVMNRPLSYVYDSGQYVEIELELRER